MDIQEYRRFRRPFERVLRQVLLEFEFFREDLVGINIHSVSSRAKSYESAAKKSAKSEIPIKELQDIAGMRIIVSTMDEIDVVARFFYRKASIEKLTIKLDKRIEREDGYRARHIVLELGGHYSRSVYPTRIEVQIQTLMQNSYNFISRAWIYNAGRRLPEHWHTEFKNVSGQLAELDAKIANLQKQVVDLSMSTRDEDPLTPFSFQAIVAEMFGEQVSIDDSVDSVLMLVDLNCETNGEVRMFFKNERISQLRERFVRLSGPTKAIGEQMRGMHLHDFYLMWGPRISAAEKFVQQLEQAEDGGSGQMGEAEKGT